MSEANAGPDSMRNIGGSVFIWRVFRATNHSFPQTQQHTEGLTTTHPHAEGTGRKFRQCSNKREYQDSS